MAYAFLNGVLRKKIWSFDAGAHDFQISVILCKSSMLPVKNKTGRDFLFRLATGLSKTFAALVLGQGPFHAANALPIASQTTGAIGAIATAAMVGVMHLILITLYEDYRQPAETLSSQPASRQFAGWEGGQAQRAPAPA